MADTERLVNKFRQSKDYTQEMLIRDLMDLVAELNRELNAMKAMLDDHEARITALE